MRVLSFAASEDFFANLVEHLHEHNASHESYADICDGLQYQGLVSQGFSFWPLFLLINELPYRNEVGKCASICIIAMSTSVYIVHRVTKENRIFAGVWYGNAKPDMSLFLELLTRSLKELYLEGTVCFCN